VTAAQHPAASPPELRVRPVHGLPALSAGDDLTALLTTALAAPDALADGDVVCVSSKAVAKVEGRQVVADRDAVAEAETVRVVARRGPLRVVRTRHGLVLAAAGVDASNTDPGTVVPLPVDPDASARRLRTGLSARTGHRVAVVVTDTAGRAWREGQSDIAVGCAGLPALVDLAGRTDAFGNVLEVTAPAVADEIAAAADLVLGKAALTPAAVVRGLSHLVLPDGEHGPGATVLVRAEGHDLFGLGARDAVESAVRRVAGLPTGFPGGAADAGWLVAVSAEPFGPRLTVQHSSDAGAGVTTAITVTASGEPVALGAFGERLEVLGWAHGYAVEWGQVAVPAPATAAMTWTLTPRP